MLGCGTHALLGSGMRALAGIKVVDFSTLLPGPLASLILAEAGAEVIKVERPGGGDELRSYEPRFGAAAQASPCSIAASAASRSTSRRAAPRRA